jgi:xanthine dehydrogenase accessory factor
MDPSPGNELELVFEAATFAIRQGREAALATVVGAEGSTPRHVGARMLVYRDASIVGTIGGGAFEHRVIQLCLEALKTGETLRQKWDLASDVGMACGGFLEVLAEPLGVRRPFHLFGGGHVARCVASALLPLGFRVSVYDDRAEWANAERFPNCEVLVGDMLEHARRIDATERTWFLLATRGHTFDWMLLEHLAPRPWAWLGLLGSRAKIRWFLDRLADQGVPEDKLHRVSAPTGLDIGSETPEEIAISIAAELVAHYRATNRPTLALAEGLRRGCALSP